MSEQERMLSPRAHDAIHQEYKNMAGFGKFVEKRREWSERTFGEGQFTESICNHIVEEVFEVMAKPDDIYEWADIILLAIDGARRMGFSGKQIADAIHVKQLVNEMRDWGGRRLTKEAAEAAAKAEIERRG